MLGTVKARWVFATVVFFSVVVSPSKPRVESEREKPFLSSSSSPASEEPLVTLVSMASSEGGQEDFFTETTTDEGSRNLEYDFYRNSCPQAETIVRSKMAWIYGQQRNVSAQLLRLFFHDSFIERKKSKRGTSSSRLQHRMAAIAINEVSSAEVGRGP